MSVTDTYLIANHTFRITSKGDVFPRAAKNYRTKTDAPEFEILVNEEDLKKEREIAQEDIPEKYYEFTALERKVYEKLKPFGFFIFHGALIAVDGSRGYLFTAKSGTGKTTHIRLYRKLFGKRCRVINGDKPLLKAEKDGIYGYGSPWCGKEFLNSNAKVRIHGLAILNRGKENSIRPISYKEAMPVLFTQIHKEPENPEFMEKTLSFLDEIGKKAKLYSLFCNMDISAAEVSYRGMTSKLSFADILMFDRELTYVIKGTSMLPLLHEGRDVVTIRPLDRKPRKYDVVLYRSRFYHASYVLHRIIGEDKQGYILAGDNQTRKEHGVQPKEIYGVLVSIERGKKTIRTDSFRYRFYSRFRTDFFFLRKPILKLEHLFRRNKEDSKRK